MEKLGIDMKLLIAQLLNFGLFFLIFRKFIAKPFVGFIKKEQKKDQERQTLEKAVLKKKEEMEQEEAKAKEKLNHQIKLLMDEAKKEAEAVKKDMLEEAKKETQEIIAQAKRQMKEESALMEQSMKQKAIDLSLLLVKQALREYLDENMQKDLTKRILSQIAN